MARLTDTVAVKVRMREQLRRDIERIAIKNDRSNNSQIVMLLEAGVLADKAGLGGIDGVIRAVQSSSAAYAVEEMSKRFGLVGSEKLSTKIDGEK